MVRALAGLGHVAVVEARRARAESAWNHHHTKGGGRNIKFTGASSMDAEQFANATSGCLARTLTGHGTCLHSGPKAKPLLDAALARLRDLAFVGIVERWAESICLFHMQFGGRCLDVEFEHLRSQPHVHKVPYPSAPNVDDTIYAEAELLFSQALKKHNVTPENCARISCRL